MVGYPKFQEGDLDKPLKNASFSTSYYYHAGNADLAGMALEIIEDHELAKVTPGASRWCKKTRR